MITTEQQLISANTDNDTNAAHDLDASQILDFVRVPDGCKVEAALVGWSTPVTDYCGVFLHFAPLEPSRLDSFTGWGREADVVISFREEGLAPHLVKEIARRWPESAIYSYGCVCCQSGRPYLYER